MKKQSPATSWESTDKFIKLVGLFRQWFEDEELEVTDFVLGRMASRLQRYESENLDQIFEAVEKEVIGDDEGEPSNYEIVPHNRNLLRDDQRQSLAALRKKYEK